MLNNSPWRTSSGVSTACSPRNSSTGITSGRCISASQAEFCSGLQLTSQALRSMNPWQRSGMNSSCPRFSKLTGAKSRPHFRGSKRVRGLPDARTFLHSPFRAGARPASRPLLLLHGTGGNEDDLLPLGRMISPGAPLLSPRGKVMEHGMPRFFRRRAEGVFDEDDVRAGAQDLADFIESARKEYGIPAPVALGYSNGANIAAGVMLLRPEAL